MADVIFTGTDGRKPMGMAEVSLTLGDMDEDHLRAAGVEMSYNEAPSPAEFSATATASIHQPHLVPAQGHPATVHGHGHGPRELQHPGPGPHHPDSFPASRKTGA